MRSCVSQRSRKGSDFEVRSPGSKSSSSHLLAGGPSMFSNRSTPKFSYLSYEENDSMYLIRVL